MNLVEHGFFHPDRGYWQTMGEPSQAVRDSYPDGTIEVPIRPSTDHHWQDGTWVYLAPPIEKLRADALASVQAWATRFTSQFTAGYSAEEIASWPVKADAARKHLAGDPQAIITAEAALTGEDPNDLSALVVQMADQYETVIAQVTGLRRATRDAIEAATTKEAIDQIVSGALSQAEAMIADLGLQDGQA
jgi:hypothetical protein